MKKFKKILVDPLINFKSLDLKINEVSRIDLTTSGLTPDEQERRANEALRFIKKNKDAIIAVGTGNGNGDAFVTSLLNSSGFREQLILLQEPNPVHVYYQIANEHLEKAHLARNIIRSRKKIDNYTGYLTNYFKEVSQGIIFLVMTLEGFFNQIIQGVPYDSFSEEQSGREFSKDEVEWFDFNTKLRGIIPAISGNVYHESYPKIYNKLTELNDLRNDLTHLKVSLKRNKTKYEDLNKRLIDFNPHDASEAVFHYVNFISANYFTESLNADL